MELIDTVSERKDSAGQGRPPDHTVASAIQMTDIQLVAYVKENGFHGIMHRNPGVERTELLVGCFKSLLQLRYHRGYTKFYRPLEYALMAMDGIVDLLSPLDSLPLGHFVQRILLHKGVKVKFQQGGANAPTGSWAGLPIFFAVFLIPGGDGEMHKFKYMAIPHRKDAELRQVW